MVNDAIQSSSMKPTGSVLVVGGGIAGMQASLDLADQGFKVYLVEKNSAIGGKMAQLDKTFPTNDCAMCTISPKLVETGRHANIELLTNTEVYGIEGQVGNFTVTLNRNPRYIDLNKCIACGDCEKVCPVEIPNTFNESLSPRKAVFKMYPQAVPNAYAIEKRGISPCRDACPAGQRAQGYIALIREKRWEDALKTIKLDNPFPAICGRICNHRCEDACNRQFIDNPVNIRGLKRFVTDTVYSHSNPSGDSAGEIPEFNGKNIAIVGAGPCGLTAAQDLRQNGFAVTVYDALPAAGGMMRFGVPEYRLPSEYIELEVNEILKLGVELKLNHKVEDIQELLADQFDAVLVAVGAQKGIRLPIPGADLPGVLLNTDFLRDVRLGVYSNQNQPLGSKVLVLGGGNVAIDCARSAVRFGSDTQMACLESLETMPAHPWEIDAASDEGVTIHPGVTFEEIVSDDTGKITGVRCTRVKSFHFDENGAVQLDKIPDSEHIIECDTVIFSVGQRPDMSLIKDGSGITLNKRKILQIDPNTFATSLPGVFAAGDCITGTSFVIDSVARGHQAAKSIIQYLQGVLTDLPLQNKPEVAQLSKSEMLDRISSGQASPHSRIPLPELTAEKRRGNFHEIEGCFDEESAVMEATRCLSCGTCSECMSCVFACGVHAIDHNMTKHTETVQIGSVILAPGYQIYQAESSSEFGFGRYPNVVTSLQFERLLSASGPTFGQIQRPSDGNTPKKIAFLQCIGSRDQTHDYCSAICCMSATKEAVMAKEHHPDLDIKVFMMDIRAFSKGYLQYYQRAKEHYGIEYVRSRVSALFENPSSKNLLLNFMDESGCRQTEEFDLIVLSVGMEISESVKDLGHRLGIELDPYGFCHTVQFNPVETSRKGIYAVGPFREPKDIPESILDASGAAAAAAADISESRFTLTTQVEYPSEIDVSGEPPRVGVFICHCGSNIGGYLDVASATEYAKSLPNVTHAESNLYSCSQDSIRHITEVVKELKLNRVVVASCTPRTHQPLFQDSIREAGLNPYLFEMANIRNQCSWVHSNNWDAATLKAKNLIKMAVARATCLKSQSTFEVPIQTSALVIGGGPAGMQSALSLAQGGFPVVLIEKEQQLGGNLRNIHLPMPALMEKPFNRRQEGIRNDPAQILDYLESQVTNNENITIHLGSKIISTKGSKGNFISVRLTEDGRQETIHHAVTILAMGGKELKQPEYGYTKNPKVITQLEFDAILALGENLPQSVVMIQCVGLGDRYCSRICCTLALKNAISLKLKQPDTEITILYQDMRVYGHKEALYTTARRMGIRFVRYDSQHLPEVVSEKPLILQVDEPILHLKLSLPAELVVLSMPVGPDPDTKHLATLFKVPTDENGFLLEAHVKLRPVDFPTEGVFMAGSAHFPKLLDETLIQAQAAAARAARILSRDNLIAGGIIAEVDSEKCVACLTCVRTCPFGVPVIDALSIGVGGIFGAAYIDPASCQGCGICAAECPARAIELHHYTDEQMDAKISVLLQPDVSFIATEEIQVH